MGATQHTAISIACLFVVGCQTELVDEELSSTEQALGAQWVPLPITTDGTVPSEMSGAIGVLRNRTVLVQDEDAQHIYDYDSEANTLTRIAFTDDSDDELNDLEAITQDPHSKTYFIMTSHSKRKDCRTITDKRSRLGRFTLEHDCQSHALQLANFTFRGTVGDSLRTRILAMLPENVRLAATINNAKEGGLDMEAFTFVPKQISPFHKDSYFIGLRGPLTQTPAPETPDCVNGRDFGDGDAFYFYLLNPNEYIDGAEPDLRGPFTIDLRKTPADRGRAFRDAVTVNLRHGPNRLLLSVGEVGFGGNPDLYLFDPKHPDRPLERVELPENSTRAVQAVTNLDVDHETVLAMFRETGATTPSDVAVIPRP